ncbi:hypothetical protein [Microcoleus sp. FACHB-672]|uniref:hypothetical protein n=1 Tax=Microcoleus sp. FACHB-672 TaxID=2692825 RepID=UPI0016846D79|nr:hypothetical protein [Microcoleus sp. FACHB-672]MBD2039692.1 hypothetical protein [Microcoleus sp. FACHB-672]
MGMNYGKKSNDALFDSRAGINRDFNTNPYQKPALNAIALMGSTTADELGSKLNIPSRHALAVIVALERERLVKFKQGRYELTN